MSEPGPVHGTEADRWGGWSWRDPHRGEHYRTCSYCGSINPDDLAAEPAWVAKWADRKYGWPHKFYVNVPNRDPDALFCIGASSSPGYSPEWTDAGALTTEQRAIIARDGMGLDYGAYLFGTRPTHHAKLYTVHLADLRLTPEARDTIQRISGLRFRFEDGGRVGWDAYA